MTAQQLFIPSKIRIGFQNRKDTFTGKLAYIIYYDEKGKIRKETSWNSWRDHKIDSIEFENTPRSGYILNKGVERNGHWGSGRSVVRVHDPRDFEFEISVDNLIGILMHSDISKRDIIEDCIFAWSGPELILLPTNSVDYQASVEYTQKQDLKVSTKELVPGRQYYRKKSDEILTYVGKFDWWVFESDTKRYNHDYVTHVNKGKKHIFVNAASEKPTFETYSVSVLSSAVSEDIVDNYAELVDNYWGTIHSQPIKGMTIVPRPIAEPISDNDYYIYRYPEMYTIVDDQLQQIYSESHYQHDFDKITQTEYNQIISYSDSLILTKVKYLRVGGYRYYGDQYDSYKTCDKLKPLLMNAAYLSDYNFNKLTGNEYVELMNGLGYGNVNYILENDRQTPRNN